MLQCLIWKTQKQCPLNRAQAEDKPSLRLGMWLKPTFRQCRKAVKRKVWFIHLACHSKILMLARGGFTLLLFHGSNASTPSCLVFARVQSGWSVGHQGTHKPGQSTYPVPGSLVTVPDSLTDTDRACREHGDPETGTSARRQRWTSEDGEAESQLWTQNSERNLQSSNNNYKFI